MKLAFLLAITASILSAQFGQIPGTYPPGQNPAGQYPGRNPNGGSGNPRGSKRTTRQEQPATHTEVVSGVVRKVDGDSFELEAEDTRFLIIQF
jgi:hypothetical protein